MCRRLVREEYNRVIHFYLCDNWDQFLCLTTISVHFTFWLLAPTIDQTWCFKSCYGSDLTHSQSLLPSPSDSMRTVYQCKGVCAINYQFAKAVISIESAIIFLLFFQKQSTILFPCNQGLKVWQLLLQYSIHWNHRNDMRIIWSVLVPLLCAHFIKLSWWSITLTWNCIKTVLLK